MTAHMIVFTATSAVAAVGVILACVGVAMLAGPGLALVVGGAAVVAGAVAGGVVLLHDDGASP